MKTQTLSKLKTKTKNFTQKHKKAVRITVYTVCAILIVLFCAEMALRFVLPAEKVKNYITAKISSAINADVGVEHISAGLGGLHVKGLSLSAGGSDILKVKNTDVRFSLIHLFILQLKVKNIIVSGIEVNIVKDANGKFNFEPMLAEAPAAETSAAQQDAKPIKAPLLKPVINKFYIYDTNVTYTDAQKGLTVKINEFNIDSEHINIKKPFKMNISSFMSVASKDVNIENLNFGLKLIADLAAIKLENASLAIEPFVVSVNNSSIFINGKLSNFLRPVFDFTVGTEKLVSASFKPMVDVPDFDMTSLKAVGQLAADPGAMRVDINRFNLTTVFTELNARGFVAMTAEEPLYDINADGKVFLDKTPQAVPMLAEFKPLGELNWNSEVKNASIKANLTAAEIGAFLPQAGTLANVNTTVTLDGLHSVSMPSLTGKLNGHAFSSKFKYFLTSKAGSVDAAFNANRVWVKPTPEALKAMTVKEAATAAPPPKAAAKSATLKQTQQELQDKLNLPPFKINANVGIKSLDAPFINADNIKFNADITDVTILLDKMQGSLNFSTEKGEIKDLYSLTEANAVTKVLFMSVGVVSKVVNSLNILSVFKQMVPAKNKKEEAALEEELAANPQKIDGKLDFDSFSTNINFKTGKADIKHGNFVSGLLSFKLAGNMDFNNRNLNMTVNAAPGRHPEEGVMPLTVKIGGTIDEPKGSMSVVSSVASLITGTAFKNPLSNAIKSGVVSVVPDSLTGGGKAADTQAQPQPSPAENSN
ncbi:AsmA protein [Elusimicrobium simillimum]|uniref:AsmA family protein n=1 Tax=Elusimicrobium simillimum TaxID=3143438 RepID=UPI003C7018D4